MNDQSDTGQASVVLMPMWLGSNTGPACRQAKRSQTLGSKQQPRYTYAQCAAEDHLSGMALPSLKPIVQLQLEPEQAAEQLHVDPPHLMQRLMSNSTPSRSANHSARWRRMTASWISTYVASAFFVKSARNGLPDGLQDERRGR